MRHDDRLSLVCEYEPDLDAELAALRLLLGMPAADLPLLAGDLADALQRVEPTQAVPMDEHQTTPRCDDGDGEDRGAHAPDYRTPDTAGDIPVRHPAEQGSEAAP